MITRNGFIRLENGVWFNIRHVKLMRVFVDAVAFDYRIEILDHAEDGWLMDTCFDTEDDAANAINSLFMGDPMIGWGLE